MSLYYFLDQVYILEGFAVSIIRYYDWVFNPRQDFDELHIGSFIECIKTVETWLKLEETDRGDSGKQLAYEEQFRGHMLRAMNGLLEPFGSMLEQTGQMDK